MNYRLTSEMRGDLIDELQADCERGDLMNELQTDVRGEG